MSKRCGSGKNILIGISLLYWRQNRRRRDQEQVKIKVRMNE